MKRGQNYPVSRPPGGNDPRFTLGLGLDVAKALHEHGYPACASHDLADLQLALFRFLYEQNTPEREDRR